MDNKIMLVRTENVDINKLVPYANNARTHSKEQIKKLAGSLREQGFVTPIVVDENYGICAGHGRYMAAMSEGYTEVPCNIVRFKDEIHKKAFIIADNKLALDAGWDNDLLAVDLEQIMKEMGTIEFSGFDEKEFSKLTKDDKEAVEDDFDINKALDAKAFVKEHDIWLLGKHRLMCGDSTKQDQVRILMDGKKANLCITDAPYNVSYKGGTGMKIKNDSFKDKEEFFNFLLSCYTNVYENLVDGGVLYAFHSDSEKVNFFNAVVGAKFHYSTTCIWVKDHFVLGRGDFQQIHEPIIYAFKDTAKHEWFSDRKQSTVWYFDRPIKCELHPTMKPLPLIAYPMKNSSQENGLVLDVFGGSGSTMMVAEQLNRISFTMEIDPKYASAIVRRYVSYKNNDASDVFCIRNGEKIKCLDIYDPTNEDFSYKEQSVNDKSKKDK